MKRETAMIDGRECRLIPVFTRDGVPLGHRFSETLRSRLSRFAKRHIIDDDPYVDESHSKGRGQ